MNEKINIQLRNLNVLGRFAGHLDRAIGFESIESSLNVTRKNAKPINEKVHPEILLFGEGEHD